jgi:osmotically-inducible protein OsmY
VRATVQHGLVTITGEVKNILIREEVIDRVLRIYGVQEVLDNLSVREQRPNGR